MASQEAMQEEIDQYKREKEAIRTMLGQIGGAGDAKKEKIINVSFIVFVISLFALDLLRYATSIHLEFIPEMFSVEIAVLLVSMKIIWMIHKQQKVEHFQFWILNTIEFQMNNSAVRIRKIEKMLEDKIEKEETIS